MAKKRTKKQKITTNERRVNTHFEFKFNKPNLGMNKNNNVNNTAQTNNPASIKYDLYKSLILAILILISLTVIYWVS
jgi:uncharacterized membrane protein YcjF (UPF0283 family)